MPAHVTWENEAEWRHAVEVIMDEWMRVLPANLDKLGELAVREAKARCPVRTGRLRNGVQSEVVSGEGSTVATLRLFDDVPYAPHVEFGTRFNRAQPFLRPGYAAAQNQYEKIMTGGVR